MVNYLGKKDHELSVVGQLTNAWQYYTSLNNGKRPNKIYVGPIDKYNELMLQLEKLGLKGYFYNKTITPIEEDLISFE
jgi:hypothetical protein